MPKEVEALVEEYRRGKISRREFIQKAIIFTGSLAAATSLFDSHFSSPARAAQVDPADPVLLSEMVQFSGSAGTLFAYQSRPKASGSYPGIVVIHADSGVEDHFQDVTRRLAKEGYVALAVDYLSRHGGTKKANPKGEGLRNMRELAPPEVVVEDSEAAFTYLRGLPYVQDDRLGVMGFCWGGNGSFDVATRVRGLKAVVVYYGRSPTPIDAVERIEAPVLAHYGGEDQRINQGIPATEAAMKKYNKSYTYKIYPGAGHAFNSDTGNRYHPDAAKEAWARTLEYLKKQLKS